MTNGPDTPGGDGGNLPDGPTVSPPVSPPCPVPDPEQQAVIGPLIDAVVVALLDCAPPYWARVKLRVQRETHPDGRQVTSVFVDSPEGYAEPVIVSQTLRDAIERLWANSRQSGYGWRRLTLDATAADDGAGGREWDFNIDLKYGA